MSDSDRREPFNPYSKEGVFARLLTRRRERNRAKSLLRAGQFDLAGSRQVKGTQGWLTH